VTASRLSVVRLSDSAASTSASTMRAAHGEALRACCDHQVRIAAAPAGQVRTSTCAPDDAGPLAQAGEHAAPAAEAVRLRSGVGQANPGHPPRAPP
jgi:hypothetical protein